MASQQKERKGKKKDGGKILTLRSVARRVSTGSYNTLGTNGGVMGVANGVAPENTHTLATELRRIINPNRVFEGSYDTLTMGAEIGVLFRRQWHGSIGQN